MIKVVIMIMIPNEPLKIAQAKQRYYYELLEALRNNRLKESGVEKLDWKNESEVSRNS